MRGQYTYREIIEQAERLRRLYESLISMKEKIIDFFEMNKPKRIYLTGCGTSFYAALHGMYLLKILNFAAFAFPASEFYFLDLAEKSSLLIPISRSGETTETVWATKKAKKQELSILALTNNPKSFLYENADLAININVGEEKSIVMTKTFSGFIYALEILSLILGSRKSSQLEELLTIAKEVPEIVKQEFRGNEGKIRQLAKKYRAQDRFIVLGFGPLYPVSMEAALKIKETSYIATESFSTLEFRHGPMASIDENVVVIGLIPRSPRFEKEIEVLREIEEKGGKIILVTNEDVKEWDVIRYDDIHEYLAGVPSIAAIQLFAYYLSIEKGYDPDKPRYLTKVVKIGERK